MKILFSLDNYDHGSGGAELAARGLCRALAARGHELRVLQCGTGRTSYDDGLVRVHTHPLRQPRLLRDRDRDSLRWNREWRPILDAFLDEYPADLVVTQNRLLYGSVEVAARRQLAVIVWAHGYGMFCPEQFHDRDPLACAGACLQCLPWRRQLSRAAIRRNLGAYREGLQTASLVLANSGYMRRVIEHQVGVASAVVYPTTDGTAAAEAGGAHDRVLFVKPQAIKGLAIFCRIARAMPDTPFLVAGKLGRSARRTLEPLPNVDLMGWVDDMKPVYARARVLLGPALLPEPFGRVYAEAAGAGVPSVASRRGGIPEAVGDGGILIDEVHDTSRWVEALRRLEDPGEHAAYASRARQHARRFASEAVLKTFTDQVAASLSLSL